VAFEQACQQHQYTCQRKDHKHEGFSDEIELGRYLDAVLDTFRNVERAEDLGTHQPEGRLSEEITWEWYYRSLYVVERHWNSLPGHRLDRGLLIID
jgi:hypothetical protein